MMTRWGVAHPAPVSRHALPANPRWSHAGKPGDYSGLLLIDELFRLAPSSVAHSTFQAARYRDVTFQMPGAFGSETGREDNLAISTDIREFTFICLGYLL